MHPTRSDVLLGGDVSGLSRSSNRGATWITSNAGVPALPMRQVASVAWHPTEPDTAFAAVGYRGTKGGFLASVDGGVTWDVRSIVPQFSGSDNVGGLGIPTPHPRSTGSLIAIDAGSGTIYAATFDDGVMRSTDGGRSWTTLGMVGTYLRSLVMDPADPDTLLVAAYGQGIWRTSDARGAASFERLVGSPDVTEELAFVGTDIYAVAGPSGIFRSTDGGARWERIGEGSLPSTGPRWTSIAGVDGCGGPILYAGSHAGGAWSVARSENGGATWTPVTAATIGTTIGGPDGQPWWLAPKKPQLMLGAKGYTAAQIAIVPGQEACGPEHVLVAGRSGVWATTDGGASWYPEVAELGTTISMAVAVDASTPGRVSAGVADWGHLASGNGLRNVTMDIPPGVTNVFDAAFDPASPSVALATGHPRSNRQGEIFSRTEPGGTWKDEGLSEAAGGKRPLGVAVGRTTAGARVLLAAVEAGGVWRKVGTAAWRRVGGTVMSTSQKTERATFAWPAGSQTVFLYDRQTGVWRSNDAGGTWVRIWAKPSAFDMTGYVAAADGEPATVYVSVGNTGVYRIDGATSGTVGSGLTPVALGAIAAPGPIDAGSAGLVATRLATPSGPAQIFLSADRGASWTQIDDDRYRASALNPRDVEITADGTIYVALNGAGFLRGTPQP